MAPARGASLAATAAAAMLTLLLAACAPAVKDDASQVNACTGCVDNTLASVTKVTLQATSTTSVTLTWTDPTDAGLTGVEVRRSSTAYPAGPSAGIEVYNGTGSTASESGLSTTSADYYAVFSSYNSGDYGPAADALRPRPIKAIAAGEEEGYALAPNGALWTWGANAVGEGGLGNTTTQTAPVQVGTGTNWAALTANSTRSVLALKTDGSLWAWGENNDGELGLGTTTGPDTCGSSVCAMSPVRVGTSTNWSKVSLGVANLYASNSATTKSYYALAIQKDGSLWAWGNNAYGQLGIGNTTSQTSPTRVGTDTNWSDVIAGASSGHPVSLAIKSDGTLWAWGSGLSSSPAQVGTDTDWTAAGSSGTSTSASVLLLKSAGTLWSWHGALSTAPTQVGSATNWAHIFAGPTDSAAVRSDGTLWIWGDAQWGELGNGQASTTGTSSPAQLGTATDWSRAVNGGASILAITTGGEAWGWGANWGSQTGTPAADSPAQCSSNGAACILTPTLVPIK